MPSVRGNAAEVPGDYLPWFAFSIGASPVAQSIKPQNRLGGSAEARGRASGCAWSATLDCSWGSSDPTEGSRQVDGTTRYLLDGLSVVAQYSAGGQRQAWYTQSLARIDEVLNVVSETGKQWYQVDALGSVYGLTNSSGVLIGNQNYDVFGAPTPAPSGPAGQPFGFTGREHELDSGLVYARARYLNPAVGRWDRADPMGFAEGTNRFAYVRNRATVWTDPRGLFGGELHKRITEQAFGSMLAGTDLNNVLTGSVDADNATYQFADYMHGMRGLLTSLEDGARAWAEHIDSQLGMAVWNTHNSCQEARELGFWQLGVGAHAVEDYYSPPHRMAPMNWFLLDQHIQREVGLTFDSAPAQEALRMTREYANTFRWLSSYGRAMSIGPMASSALAWGVFGQFLFIDATTGAEP